MPNRRYEKKSSTTAKEGKSARAANEGQQAATAGYGEPEFTMDRTDEVTNNLDPQLQDILLSVRAGQQVDSALVQEAEDGELVAEVLAVLRDAQKPVPGLKVVRVIGDVATGTVEVNQIEAVRKDPNVISLKGAKKVSPTLQFSIPEIRASQAILREELPAGTGPITGSGMIVGVVDNGCDFAHENFRNADGTTRILYLWDQSRLQNSMSPAGFPYGREFSAQDINAALQTPDPYATLAYNLKIGAHGTHVMDIAAGNGRGTDAPGVAPKADIIFVQISSGDFTDVESFGNSRRLLEAVDYIFTKAKELGKSAVINISLGTHGGPHDGTTPAERGFDELLKIPGRAIVISAGNSWQRRSHARGRLASSESRVLRWEKFGGDVTGNELEIWYSGSGKLDVTLISPSGQRIGAARLGETVKVRQQGVEVGRIIHRNQDPLNGDNQVDILLDSSVPTGIWGVELKVVGASAVDYHAWIERDDDNPIFGQPNQSKFVAEDEDRSYTLGSISCGRGAIVVGSYKPAVRERDLSRFSSEGPTRDGKQKPEVSAPGDEIAAAASRSRTGTIVMSGTSMAAPHVTGLVALLMQAAGRPLSIAEIRQALASFARRPLGAGSWDPRYGTGRVDVAATLLSVLNPEPTEFQMPIPSGIPAALRESHDGVPSLDRILETFAGLVSNSKVRVQLELEIEPVAK